MHTKNISGNLLLLPHNTGIAIIDTTTIIRIQAISNYSKLFFSNNQTMVVAKVLKWFEGKLDSQVFLRIHRTHLVNKYFIHQYIHGGSIQLKNGERLEISKRRKALFLQSF